MRLSRDIGNEPSPEREASGVVVESSPSKRTLSYSTRLYEFAQKTLASDGTMGARNEAPDP